MTSAHRTSSVLVIGGPTGVGKTTVANALVDRRRDCALVEYDAVHSMVPRPMLPFWEPDGHRQRIEVEQLVLSLVRHFAETGRNVVVTDVLTDAILARYRAALAPFCVTAVGLRLSKQANYDRFVGRPWRALTDDDWERVYGLCLSIRSLDFLLDADALSVAEAVEAVEARWTSK